MNAITGLSRRRFGQSVAGLVIAFSMAPRTVLAQTSAPAAPALPPDLATNKRMDSWLHVEPTGTVSVFTGKVELGQGNLTALAQMVAEELDITFGRVRMMPTDTSHSPNEGYTAGSASIEAGGAALRSVSAEARAIMLGLAAAKLGVPVGDLSVADGTITAASGAKSSYWKVVADGMLPRDATNSVAPKPYAAHTLVGKPIPRIDIPAKVTGGEAYVQDMRLPGMVFGRVVRPPSYDAELVSLDDSAVRGMPGVLKVVQDGRFIGVVAEREEQAIAARAALQRAAVWKQPSNLPDEASIHDFLRAVPDAQPTVISEKKGPPPDAVKTITATYSKPFISHASIGPSCSVAHIVDGVVNVWSHTQGPFPLRQDIAKAMGLPLNKVQVVSAQGSGCYGHNGADDVGLDAAFLARAMGDRPVKVQWMRDDEFAWEPYGSAITMTASGGVGADGGIVDWNYDLWASTFNMRPGQPSGVNLLAAWHMAKPLKQAVPAEGGLPAGGGDRNAIPTYIYPRQKITDHFVPDMPLRVSALRTLGGFCNVFAVESFMDELANAAGADPLEFRLRHLEDTRAKAVLQAAADKAGWKPNAKGDGERGFGIAYCRYETTKTYIAMVAEVRVNRATGEIKVVKITSASDSGQIINSDGIANQIEGGIIQATSWTMKEAVHFDRQKVTTRDWASYPILTFPEVPEVDIVLMDHPELPSLGAGEASQCPTPAAIANAVFNATGVRLRDLPFTPARVKGLMA